MEANESLTKITNINGLNYSSWSFQIKLILMDNDLWSIVDPGEVKPEGGDVGLINKFNTRQNKALAKICLSIGEEQQNHIRHLNSPKEVCDELQRLYAPRDSKHRILQLRRKLYSQKFCQHANMDAYLGSINLIVSELTGVGDKIEDGDLSMLILCGMPEDWDNVISTMCNLPESEFTSANIRRKLLAEAERRYATTNEGMGALSVRNSNKKQFPHEHQGSKTVRKCFGCGKTGHIARDCFKLKKNNGKQQEKGAIHQHHEAKNLNVMYNAAVVSEEDTWVIDSGDTHHMTPNRRYFSTLNDENVGQVTTIDGTSHSNIGRGNAQVDLINNSGQLRSIVAQNAMFVPGIRHGVLSVLQIVENGHEVIFDKKGCHIYDNYHNLMIRAEKIGRLYLVRTAPSRFPESGECSNSIAQTNNFRKFPLNLWHQRLMHINYDTIVDMMKREVVIGLNCQAEKPDKCSDCMIGKSTKRPFLNLRSTKETQTPALVHCDLMGPFNIESWGGSRFVLTIIDDASRYTRVYFLKRKGDTLEKFKEWMKEAENQTGFSLKRILTDNGLEFCSSPWDIFTKAHGIVHERTMVYTPEQNGVAERMNRTLLNLVRSTVNSCNLPTASWAELTNTAAYLRNRVTNRHNEEKTPFELWFGKRPALQHLRAIGCETFVHVPKQRRNSKLQPRATKGILVGYSLQGRGWRIWIPEKRQVVESINCVFKEEILYKQPKRERDTLPSVHFSSKEASFQEESNADQPVDRETEELIGTTGGIDQLSETLPENLRSHPMTLRSHGKTAESPEEDNSGGQINATSAEDNNPTYEEAMNSPEVANWIEAIEEERESLERHDVWQLQELPKGIKPLKCRWVLNKKINAVDGTTRYKARLVAKGFTQRRGIDYNEVYTPVSSFETIRLLSAIATEKDWFIDQFDVKSAYLHGTLNETIYMEQPECFKKPGEENLFCKLKKSIYGLKQSGRCWNKFLNKQLHEIGFQRNPIDPSIYEVELEEGRIILSIYVDDIFAISENQAARNKCRELLNSSFEVKYLGPISHMLGVSFKKSEDGSMTLSHSNYIEELLQRFRLQDAKDIVDRKGVSGHLIILAGAPIIWRSTKQTVTALSTMESEYIALSSAVKDITWDRLKNRIFSPCKPVPQVLSPQMTRWSLTLSSYDYFIEYRSGKGAGHADALSRIPLKSTENTIKEIPVMMIDVNDMPPISTKEITEQARSDKNLKRVLPWVLKGWPTFRSNPRMSEGEKVSHLIKGVAEEVYQALVGKNISTVDQFVAFCRRFEAFKRMRVAPPRFNRLPNVTTISTAEPDNLEALVRRIVREEVQKFMAPPSTFAAQDIDTPPPDLRDVIRSEIQQTLAPISAPRQPESFRPRRQYLPQNDQGYRRRTEGPPNNQRTQWRTEDDRPICFHCGRPGHVARYCRDRRQAFADARLGRETVDFGRPRRDNYTMGESGSELSQGRFRNPSPYPHRGRFQAPRRTSQSPARRPSRSPSRRKIFWQEVVINQDVFGSRDVVVTGSKRLQLEKGLFIPTSLVRFLHGRAVLWVTNSTHQSQVIPSDMKVGTMQDLEVGSISNLDACSEIAGKDEPAGTAEDYVGHLVTNAEDARMLARLNILQAQSKDKELYDKKHQEVTYKEGDLVWVFTPVRTVGLSEKFLKRNFGPYRVIRKISSVNYQVEGVTDTRRRRKTQDIVHVVRMKPYHDPEVQEQIAQGHKMANNLTSPLPLNLNATDLYSEYKHWMNSYLIYELASGVSTKKDDVKRATLLHCLGPQVQRIFFNLPEEKDTQRKQNTDENIDSYVIALRELVKSCEFGNLEEDMIRDQIIEKCYNRQLKEKLLQQDNLNLQRTIEISRMFETAKEEFRVLTNEDMTSINRVNYKNNFQAANESTVKGPKAHNVYHQKGSTSKVSTPNLEECYRCGLTTHPPYKCGARNMKCTFCNKMGHLNRVCRNKNKYKNIEGKKRNIQNISENNEDSDEYTFFLGSDNKESIYIDGKEITMTIDTGSDTTFIGLENLKNIFPKSQMPTLNGTERKFYAYGQTSPLPCCGYFFADVSWGERSIKEQIFVIEGKAEPLLGKKASFELEIIKRGTKIRNIQQEVIPKDIYNLIQENMNLFQGQGNVKGYSQKITLKENVTPVAQRCRHFPYKMVEAINQELDKIIEDGIIEEVHEASEWISNIVAVPKKGTEEIRLCVDLREVNKAIVRERYPIQTVDNILQALQGAKVFAKLDAKKGFWQIELDEKSRPLTTFITPRGCYRFCKIPFGLCSAPEAFQKAMNSILSHLEGVLCYIDDVIVYAQSIEQLDQRVKKVFERFQQVGLKLNKSKCKFSLNELEILGHIVSKDGIRPDPKKIESVLSFSKPENVDSLKSFLGTCGFLRKFIPDFSKLAEPLNNLTRKDIKWKWSKKEEDSFRKLKEALTKNPCLAYFDMNAPTEVIADASPVGLGAVLLQRQNDGSKKPVAYASRSLTNVERRYSQIEKEALGCVWAVEHFNDYLWGNKFVLKTDHKPLIYMLNPKNATVLPPRIERLSWRLQPYDYEIEYLKGKQNIADIFSRKPLTNISCENIVDDYVEKVLSIFSEEMKAISLNDIKKQSEADPFFKFLTKIIQTGNWPYQIDDDELKSLHKFKEELSVYDNLILKGKRIVIPTDLRRNILDLAHETHQGIARTKQILREKYYWPNMDKDIERRIKNCYICEVNQPLRHDQPLTTIPIPPRPWYKVGVDLVGPIDSKYILTLIDYYSSFPEAIIINDISSKTIISKLKEIFARYGFPIEIVSDNGLQFVSKDTEQFFMKLGIKHIRVSPYYPKSNGKIERFHRYLKKQLISVKLQGKDWKEELQCVLMAYRSTPHPSTGKTPALLLFSREIRNKLNDINDNDSLMDKEVMEHNQAYKERMKKYADSKNKALPHDFKKGNIVYVANTEMKSKLTPNYDNQRFIILETISPNSFKLVNTETGSFIIRNAKHLRHANVLQDFNKGIDLNTTLIKTPEIRMELPSTSRYLPEQEGTLEDIVPEEQIAISDMDCLYPNESPNENENKTVITRSGRQIH
ncbi:K02A2.6-like, partial [Cordylochernes scorpioides]